MKHMMCLKLLENKISTVRGYKTYFGITQHSSVNLCLFIWHQFISKNTKVKRRKYLTLVGSVSFYFIICS